MVSSDATNALRAIDGAVVLAGAGKMGGALLAGWLAQGLDPARVAVIDPHVSDDIHALAAKGLRVNPAPSDIGAADALVLAVKPQMFHEAAAALRPLVAPSTLVVSIMAGTTIAAIKSACGGNVVRAMPNTPAAIGRGITVAVPDDGVGGDRRAIADA
ncbi:MAG: NAD(P)-binding domain-containing protein, partial [Xanthobacteraceae bacterium]